MILTLIYITFLWYFVTFVPLLIIILIQFRKHLKIFIYYQNPIESPYYELLHAQWFTIWSSVTLSHTRLRTRKAAVRGRRQLCTIFRLKQLQYWSPEVKGTYTVMSGTHHPQNLHQWRHQTVSRSSRNKQIFPSKWQHSIHPIHFLFTPTRNVPIYSKLPTSQFCYQIFQIYWFCCNSNAFWSSTLLSILSYL